MIIRFFLREAANFPDLEEGRRGLSPLFRISPEGERFPTFGHYFSTEFFETLVGTILTRVAIFTGLWALFLERILLSSFFLSEESPREIKRAILGGDTIESLWGLKKILGRN